MAITAHVDVVANWLVSSIQAIIMLCKSKINLILPLAMSSRFFVTSRPECSSKYFTYHRAPKKDGMVQGSKPPCRVLLFPWLGASKRGIEKYAELYHDAGMDVIEVHSNYKSQFLWPRSVRKVTSDVIPSLHAMVKDTNDTFLVHAASIGAYAYTVFHMDLKSRPEHKHLTDRIVGHVFDSIVIGGLNYMATGVAVNASSNRLMQSLIVNASLLYFSLTKKHTVEFYDEAVAYFHQELAGRKDAPSLFYHCGNDPLADPDAMSNLLQVWRKERNLKVLDRYWPKSVHAGHFRQNEDEYLAIFKEYMNLVENSLVKKEA